MSTTLEIDARDWMTLQVTQPELRRHGMTALESGEDHELFSWVDRSQSTNDAGLYALITPNVSGIEQLAATSERQLRFQHLKDTIRRYLAAANPDFGEDLANELVSRLVADVLRMDSLLGLNAEVRNLCGAESIGNAVLAIEGPGGTIEERLSEFRGMENGWLNGEGVAPSAKGLDWLADALVRYYPSKWPRPHLYPTEEGYIRAEWSSADCDARIEIDLNRKIGDWFAFAEGREDSEEDLDLSSEAGWKRLSELLMEWLGAE